LNDAQEKALRALKIDAFPASDKIMSRCISTAIGLLWTEEQIKERGEKIVAAVKKVLARKKASVA
jgi:8-amino-3,8-dideoxy-alpha-D-manno-octulosonate transaminase